VARFGDVSYGLYLYGWPAEQVAKQLTGTDNPLILFAAALPLALGLALLSYHAVERVALEKKGAVAARLHSVVEFVLEKSGRARVATTLGARIGLIIGAVALVLSQDRWWYVATGNMQVALGTNAGAAVGAAAYLAVAWIRPRAIGATKA
jgi:hypothetical protein